MEKKFIFQGRVCLLQLLGKGGQGSVFLAYDNKLEKYWAVKKMKKEFQKEIEILKNLEHPGIPRIVDVWEEDGFSYLLMDYLEGITLEAWIKSGRPIEWSQRFSWMLSICDILAYLHKKEVGIVYQDLKPSNILIQVSGQVRLVDFGTAGKREDGASRYGTKAFAAPEQFLGRAEIRTDIYSAGKVMDCMLRGKARKTHIGKKWISISKKCLNKRLNQRLANFVVLKKKLTKLQYEYQHRNSAGFGAAFLSLGILVLMGGMVKRQELLMETGALINRREEEDLVDAADYKEASAYFLNRQKKTKNGSLYGILAEAMVKEAEQVDWKMVEDSLEKLDPALAGGKWEEAREQVFIAGFYLNYEKELNLPGREAVRNAVRLLEYAWETVRGNPQETFAPVYRVEIIRQLLDCYMKLECWEESIRCCERLRKEQISQELEQKTWLEQAAIYRQMQEYTKAADCYERLLEKFPDYPSYYCSYAMLYLTEKRDFSRAEEIMDRMKAAGVQESGNACKKIRERIQEEKGRNSR